MKDRKTSLSVGASRGNTKSNYESAKDQAGIRAGKEGIERISDTAGWHHLPEQKMRKNSKKISSPEVRRRPHAPH